LAASALVGGLHHHLRNSPPSSGTSRLPVLIPVCAENLIRIDCVTESQLIVLQRRVSGRAQLTNGDRLFLVMLYRWFPSVLKAISQAWRAFENRKANSKRFGYTA